MAVYTRITAKELQDALSAFNLTLTAPPTGASDGIENSTYFFSATDKTGRREQFVLTILESISPRQMHFSASLTLHLAANHLPVPAPLYCSNGEGSYHFTIKGKEALIFPRVTGSHPLEFTPNQCATIGEFLANAHLCANSFPHVLDNSRGSLWMRETINRLDSELKGADRELVEQQLRNYQLLSDATADLPRAAIHGDLFPDNTLFEGEQLMGVIDFYNACNDWVLLDLAIAVNAWGSPAGGASLSLPHVTAMLTAYSSIRGFTDDEKKQWQTILCLTATRFWLSRLLARYQPPTGSQAPEHKDPDHYRAKLLERLKSVPPLP